MRSSCLEELLSLRLIIGFLGEKSQYAWWSTAFYEPSSRLFLEPVFSRTSRLAQYHGVLEAARRIHDEHLSAGSYHLFRLPEEVEEDLHAIAQSAVGEGVAGHAPKSREEALGSLKRFAGEERASEGPTAVGNIKDL